MLPEARCRRCLTAGESLALRLVLAGEQNQVLVGVAEVEVVVAVEG